MLSILIVNWNTCELLDACLRSIEQAGAAESEIIVVDNASTDGSAKMVRENHPSVQLIASPTNTGYAKGNNLAFEQATGELLLTLNPDTELNDQTLPIAVSALRRFPRCGCVSVRLVGTDGKTQRSVRGFPSFLGILGDLLRLRFGAFDAYRLSRFDYSFEQEAPQPMGTFLLFDRQALDEVGDSRKPFDEGFPIFFNEVDLLKRLADRGWHCRYVPSASVIHHGGESTKLVRESMIWESHRSLVRYLRKHSGVAGRLGLNLLLPAIYMAAFIRAKGYHGGFRA